MTASFVHPAFASHHVGAERAADVAGRISAFFGRLRADVSSVGLIAEIRSDMAKTAPTRVASL